MGHFVGALRQPHQILVTQPALHRQSFHEPNCAPGHLGIELTHRADRISGKTLVRAIRGIDPLQMSDPKRVLAKQAEQIVHGR